MALVPSTKFSPHSSTSIHDIPLEIIWNVVAALKPKDRSRLAQTCHYMSDAAADVQWRDLDDIRPLLRLLPQDNADVVSLPARTILAKEWDRWDYYSRRVRSLYFEWNEIPFLTQESLNLLTLSLAERGYPSLLPHLRSLVGRVEVLRPLDAEFIGLLLCPQLRVLDLGREDVWHEGADESLPVLLGHIVNRAPVLESLGLHFPATEQAPRELTEAFATMTSLVSLDLGGDVIMDDTLLQAIGRLPHLQHFWCPRTDYGETILGPLPAGSFPSLLELETNLEIALAASHGYRDREKVHVHLHATAGPRFQTWSNIVQSSQFAVSIRHTLRQVEITILAYGGESEAQVIQPLLNCDNLERLVLEGDLFACDMHNLKYARNWTELKSLHCEPRAPGPMGMVGMDTLASLAAHCPAVEQLCIPVDPSTKLQENVVFLPFKKLRTLGVKDWKIPPKGSPRDILVQDLRALKPVGDHGLGPRWEFGFPPPKKTERKEWVDVMSAVDAVWFLHPKLQEMFRDP